MVDIVNGDDASSAADAARQDKLKPADSASAARTWAKELAASKKWMTKFTKQARDCEKAYLDQADTLDDVVSTFNAKTNLFWSNVQVILSAIYARLPKATVDRKHKDFQDDVSRVAGVIMQRILNNDIEREHDDTNAAMRDAVQDRFISGLGQVWCRYEVETDTSDEPVIDPMTGQPQMDPTTGQPVTQPQEKITAEDAEVDYVYWDDFRYAPCRRWRECRWVARRVYMNEKRLASRFKLNDAQLHMIPMQSRSPGEDASQEDDVLKATPTKQAAVWEIWNKEDFYVCWYVEGTDFVLDRQLDPMGLDEFFPCPMPIVATTLTRAFIPRPDYAMVQDLYRELDRVNAKLSHLTAAVKAAGVYDKNAGAVQSLLTKSVENALVPVDNWSAFTEKGGLKGVCDWLPIDQFVNAIVQLTTRKQQLQQDLYEVLGLSDIMRGASVASETATAQQLKVAYGGARLSRLQDDVARFVSAVMRIRANIISNHFQPETMVKRSLIDRTPDEALVPQAVQMLKDFGTSMYSITVTSDALAAPDWAAEKEARTEFLGATSNFIMASAPLVQGNPIVGSFLIKLLQWAAAGFKGSATIEGVLDQAAQQLQQQAQQPPPPPPPSPEDQKHLAQAKESEAKAGKAQAEQQRTAKEAALIPPVGGGPAGSMPPQQVPGDPYGPAAGPIVPMRGGPQPMARNGAAGPPNAPPMPPTSPMPGAPVNTPGM